MNMHHITKSLFVGAAIAGIGVSSGRAEIVINDSVREQLKSVTEKMLQSHRLEVDGFLKEHKDEFEKLYKEGRIGRCIYSDDNIKSDVEEICEAICGTKKESFIGLLNGDKRCGFFKKDALGVFLRYNLFGIAENFFDDFKKEWSAFYVKSRHTSKNIEFYCPSRMNIRIAVGRFLYSFAWDYFEMAKEPEPGFWVYEDWSAFCKEHKGLRYFIEPFIRNLKNKVVYVTDEDVILKVAKEVFSEKYIAEIEDILYTEISRQLETGSNVDMWMRLIERTCESQDEKEVCRAVAVNFRRYKKIKGAIDAGNVTKDILDTYKRFSETKRKLTTSKGPLHRLYIDKLPELIGSSKFVFELMRSLLEKMRSDIETGMEKAQALQ